MLVATGLSSGALVGVVVATQTGASAAGFGPNAFMNVDGSIRYVANTTPAPTNQFGWANSGATTPDAGCAGSAAGAVDVPGTNGLYNCGAPNPTVANGVPLPPKYIGPSSVLSQSFFTTPDGNAVPGCGTGTYDFPGSQVFNEGLSQMSYGFKTNVPQKDALSDAYVVSRINSDQQVEVYFGAQRTDGKADAHIDFQFLQDNVSAGGTCSGTMSGSREEGDMLVEINFQNGGSNPVPAVYMWECTPGTLAQPPTGTKCDTAPADWVQQPVPSAPVLAVVEATNVNPTPCGGWVCQNLTSAGLVDSQEFFEGAINLGRFGFGVGCGSSVLVETRTSGSSSNSQLASLAKPSGFATCAPTTTTTTPSSKTIQFGQSLTDSVTVGGNASLGTPKGDVKFYVCSNVTTGCTSTANPLVGTTNSPNPVGLDGSGKATSPSYTPPAPGNYCFAGYFTPTPPSPTQPSFYSPSSDTSSGECFTVTALTPTFTTSATSSAITFGGTNTDTATVTGVPAGGTPGGTIQFDLCQVPSGSTTCSGGDPVGSPVGLKPGAAADSATATSGPGTPTGAGTWCFNASYSATAGGNYSSVSHEDNASNAVGTAPSECFTVNKQASKSATTASGTATFGGGTLSDQVTVSPDSGTGPAPTGTVQFYVCETANTFCPTSTGTPDGSPVQLIVPQTGSTSSANAPDFTPTSPGTWCFSAVYSGNSNYLGSEDNTTADNTDSSECVTVGKAPTSTSTVVFDAGTNSPWATTETVGASAYDTGTVVPFPSFTNAPTPTGTFSYVFFNGNGCSSTAIQAGSSSLTGHSSTEGPLAAGAYSFRATYSGDDNYSTSTGPCENFSVNKGTVNVGTVVFDDATNHAWSGSETTGASAYDTSTVTGSSSAFAPKGGTVSYMFFPNDSCTVDTGSSAGSGALGTNSNTEGPLGAGSYSFEASYSGDTNYNSNVGSCEPFSVNKGTVDVATVVFDAATNHAWSGSETTGASAYDTSTVTGSSSAFAPNGGTVSYTFFRNDSCTVDTGSSAGSGLALGTNSNTEGPLGAGSYSFEASYSGDTNYNGNVGTCEPFNVGQGTSATTTTVFDAATNSAWTGSETGTPSAYDTSTVTPSFSDIAPTGTISYTFFTNSSCTADTGSSAGGGDLSNGAAPNSSTEGPLSQGLYSFQATYSGDTNYAGSTGDCEPFTVSFPVITAAKQSSPKDGSVVHPGDTVTYTITLSNAGMLDATGVSLIDAIPAGTTYVPNSASDNGALTSTAISWSGLTVPGGGTKAVSFKVTVNSNDTDGQVIPNHAIFPDINTPQDQCTQSSDTAPQLQTDSIASVHSAAVSNPTMCDTNTVTLTVAIPIINVVKSEPTPGDGQTVTAGQSAPITYKLAVTNAGSADATNVVVTDVIPTGATYVTGSATPSGDVTYDATTKTLTWTIPTVAAKSGSTPGEVDLTFQVTVNAADANGSTLTNQAAFANINTPNCTAATAPSSCLTNTVSNPVVAPPPLQVTPAPVVSTTTTTAPPKHALAFTGLDAKSLAIGAVTLVGVGTFMVLLGRRRRPENN